MIRPALTATQEAELDDVLKSAFRKVNYKARLYKRNGDPLPISLVLSEDSEGVVVDTGSDPDRTAHVTLIDEFNQLPISGTGSTGTAWFAKELGLWWEVFLPTAQIWATIPTFRGPIYEVSRSGIQVYIDAAGKELDGIDPALVYNSKHVPAHTPLHEAIRHVADQSDLNPEGYRLDRVTKKLDEPLPMVAGQEPWRKIKRLAQSVDKQAFFDAEGVLRLRDTPSNPAVKFTIGSDSQLLDYPEERLSREGLINAVVAIGGDRKVETPKEFKTTLALKASATDTTIEVVDHANISADLTLQIGGQGGNPERKVVASKVTTTITLKSALARNHAKGAPVIIYGTETKKVPIIGRAKLPQSHPLSEGALGVHLVKVLRRPNIRKKERIDEVAESKLDRQKIGITDEISLSFIPDPRIEPLDKGLVDMGDGQKRVNRFARYTIPHNPNDAAEANWSTRRIPKR